MRFKNITQTVNLDTKINNSFNLNLQTQQLPMTITTQTQQTTRDIDVVVNNETQHMYEPAFVDTVHITDNKKRIYVPHVIEHLLSVPGYPRDLVYALKSLHGDFSSVIFSTTNFKDASSVSIYVYQSREKLLYYYNFDKDKYVFSNEDIATQETVDYLSSIEIPMTVHQITAHISHLNLRQVYQDESDKLRNNVNYLQLSNNQEHTLAITNTSNTQELATTMRTIAGNTYNLPDTIVHEKEFDNTISYISEKKLDADSDLELNSLMKFLNFSHGIDDYSDVRDDD